MRRLMLAVAVLFSAAGLVGAQESPRAIIERAIVAHGGKERLSRVRADRVRTQGTLHVGIQPVAFTTETTVQLPSQYKSVVRLMVAENKTHTLVHLLDGEKASILVEGQPQPMSAAHLAQLKQTLQIDHAVRLVPLLKESEFTLAPLGETAINGRLAVGVRVTGQGQREVQLYFDKPSGLLVKTEHMLDGAGGKDVRQEAFYSGYRDLGGYRRPGKVVVLRDGRKVMEAELLDAMTLDRIDPGEFTKP